MTRVLRLQHWSLRTERSYLGWLRGFYVFTGGQDPAALSAEDVEQFISHLGVDEQVAASTQNQAYGALLFFFRHALKRDAPPDAPKTMRVDYYISEWTYVSEWVCFEHAGYARWKAEKWWRRRSPDPVPGTAEQAVEIAEGGGVAWTKKIVVRSAAGEKYDRIVGYTLAPKPEPVPVGDAEYDVDDVPF